MNPKWIIGLLMLFILAAIFSGIMEQTYVGTAEETILERLMSPNFPEFSSPLGAITGFISLTWGWIQALWDVFTWNYAMYQGDWAIVRWVFLLPLSIGLVVSLVLAAVRGVSSA